MLSEKHATISPSPFTILSSSQADSASGNAFMFNHREPENRTDAKIFVKYDVSAHGNGRDDDPASINPKTKEFFSGSMLSNFYHT